MTEQISFNEFHAGIFPDYIPGRIEDFFRNGGFDHNYSIGGRDYQTFVMTHDGITQVQFGSLSHYPRSAPDDDLCSEFYPIFRFSLERGQGDIIRVAGFERVEDASPDGIENSSLNAISDVHGLINFCKSAESHDIFKRAG